MTAAGSSVFLTRDIYTAQGVAAATAAFRDFCSVEVVDCGERLEVRFTEVSEKHEPQRCVREFLNYSLQASIKTRLQSE